MRKILFRGKRVDNGEWVRGLPVNYCNKTYVLVLTDFEEERVYEQYPHKEMWPYEVIPETVGQYTGLKDKNGIEIYEGDILINRQVRVWEDYTKADGTEWSRMTNDYEDLYGEVKFNEILSRYTLNNKKMIFPDKRLEVIGNIHDNPEILEVE